MADYWLPLFLALRALGNSGTSLRSSTVAQLVKNLPEMWETWIQSLGWEDPLEEGMTTTSIFLLGESPWTEEATTMGSQRVRHD